MKQHHLGEQIVIGMQHVIKTLKPTTAPFERTIKGIKGEPGKGPTIYEVPKELAGIFGFRLEKVDPKKALGFYLYDLRQGQSDATKLFTGGKFGVLSGEPKTPKDVIERYFVANKALFKVRKEAQTHLRNAMKLGVNPKQLEDIFEKRGIPKSLLDELLSGQFRPFYPSEKIEERFQDIAIEGGQPNPYLGAIGVMKAMEGALKRQNLYQDFQLELENFIPDTDPQGQSALPPQVMPSQEVIQTAAVQAPGAMNQGLTATENALLSEEEKQIRLRQRISIMENALLNLFNQNLANKATDIYNQRQRDLVNQAAMDVFSTGFNNRNTGIMSQASGIPLPEFDMANLPMYETKQRTCIMPNGNKINPKTTREHLLSIYGYITGLKNDVKHMHDGIHDLGGKIDKIYWVLLGTVGAVSLLLLEKVLDKGWF